MKKFLIALLAVFMLTACATKNEEVVTEPIEETQPKEEENVGGWTLNTNLPEMNDADFDSARKKIVGVNYSPICILGTQPVAGENIQYLCYATTVTPNAKPELKVVTLFKDLENNESEITVIEDFKYGDYLSENGENTPEGLMGGWQDASELPNFLSEDENKVFEKALEGLDGVSYKPVATLATQVVAGTNYAFLATGTAVVENPVTHLYVINVYADLQGNAIVNNIYGINLMNYIAK